MIRHRWLLLSIFIAALLIVMVILGSGRGGHSTVTISFLGYTNLSDGKVRSAVFVLRNPASFIIDGPWVEAQRLEDNKPHPVPLPIRPQGDFHLAKDKSGGKGELWSYAVDEPLEHGRWRASWHIYHPGLRLRVLMYATRHRLLPPNWRRSLSSNQIIRGPFPNYVTDSSIWLTNSATLGLP
ncbi:MAG: hypothetical protein QOJ40_1653 [Verrucomicrobiota bacterium]